jgi:hypothetical protein
VEEAVSEVVGGQAQSRLQLGDRGEDGEELEDGKGEGLERRAEGVGVVVVVGERQGWQGGPGGRVLLDGTGVDVRPDVEGEGFVGELPNDVEVLRLRVVAECEVTLHVAEDDDEDLLGGSATLRMYFLMPTLRLMEPWRALMNSDIHSSKLPSKHSLTVSSSTPSSIEKVFTTCSTTYISFSRKASPSSACAKIWKNVSSSIAARR